MIIFLYGVDTYRSRQKLKELKDKFVREVDPEGNSLVFLDGENISHDEINQAVSSPSLFSRKRMIVVENIFKNKDRNLSQAIADYLASKNKDDSADNIIVFWDENDGSKLSRNKLFIMLSAASLAQNFKPLSNTEATNWIKKQAKDSGVILRQQAAFYLTSLFGSDLWQLTREVNKLANYKKALNPGLLSREESKEIVVEVEDVDELCRGKIDDNIFAFTDALSHRNQALALELFEKELSAGVADNYLLFMIIRQVKILIQVKDALENGLSSRQIINQLKLHPFVAQKSIGQAGKFSLKILKQLFDRLLVLDQKLKTGQADFKTSVSMLIVSL